MKINNDIFNLNPEGEIVWVEWEYLIKEFREGRLAHIPFNRCHYGQKEAEKAREEGYFEDEIKEAEKNITKKRKELLAHGWSKHCAMYVGIYDGIAYIIDGNNRFTALERINVAQEPMIKYVRLEVVVCDSEKDLHEAFDKRNSNICPQTKMQKLGHNARLHGGAEEEGYGIIRQHMSDTGSKFSATTPLFCGYKLSHKDTPILTKSGFRRGWRDIADAHKFMVNSFADNKQRKYVANTFRNTEFTQGFNKTINKLDAYYEARYGKTSKNISKDLAEAYMDVAKAVINEANTTLKAEKDFKNTFTGRSLALSAAIEQACEDYNDSNNEIFNRVFRHYNKVGLSNE